MIKKEKISGQQKMLKQHQQHIFHGPTIIGENAEVRHCAFIRGKAIVGNNTVVGNSTELKNVILFNNVQVPHYNYIGEYQDTKLIWEQEQSLQMSNQTKNWLL